MVIMAYKEYLERIKERDQNLIKYHEANPGMSQRALAKVFKISQARVSKIIQKQEAS